MLFQMVSLVLDVVAGLIAGTCLLRFWMQRQRISFHQPLGRFVFAVTDWLLLPLRRVIPPWSSWDVSSLVGAFLIKLVQYTLLWLVAGGRGAWGLLPLVTVVGLAQLVVSALSALVLVLALLSWVNPGSPMYGLTARLCDPFLKPFQRVVPLIGGVDLSPIALLLVLQLAGMALAQLQMGWMY
ncbi:YggT family protein [Limnohabitans radicicola]|uniref:YggT family protein n=1 Tax=Limnohabitans radicicola TaxID=2771427 RepID=A0A927FKN4_9BURK|nr:YggT family protein [Limnohabitans radicicola]MBD8051837.1 YggT family protein [Limnohabitans radicicola]